MQPAERDALLAGIEVGEVLGVGRRIEAHLQAAGIQTVKDLRAAPSAWLRSRFGVVMERTGCELRGIAQYPPAGARRFDQANSPGCIRFLGWP